MNLDRLDEITHDPAQTHLSTYASDGRGPYPSHPHGGER